MITFEPLTIEECNIIMAGLAELPLKVSMALVQKLQAQAQSQLNKSESVEISEEH